MPDPASVRANELGSVPVLMFHQLLDDPGSNRFDITPAQFVAELKALYDGGFVPITAAALATGSFDIPAGKHPVVLTFDDGTTSQFGLTADGKPKPGTAVALLLDFAAKHPGFTPVATMYVSFDPPPFAGTDAAKGLRWLVDRGFEIGNHTLDHTNLRLAGPAKAQQEILDGMTAIESAVPGYRVTTIALPMGVYPKPASLALAGTARGRAYRMDGVMQVGSNPAPSPYSAKFNPLTIPRIRAQSAPGPDAAWESKHWMKWLLAQPDRVFTSDGDPGRVSFPRGSKRTIAPKYRAVAHAY